MAENPFLSGMDILDMALVKTEGEWRRLITNLRKFPAPVPRFSARLQPQKASRAVPLWRTLRFRLSTGLCAGSRQDAAWVAVQRSLRA